MTLIALYSLKGSPGVTTAALGLASGWPAEESPVVVECDPAGGDLLARYRLDMTPGLVTLAAASRHETPPGLLWQHTQRLPGGLPVVVGPAGAEQASAALAQITGVGETPLRRVGDRPGSVVIADCGRIAPGSAALDVVRIADLALVLVRAHDDGLSHLAVSLDRVRRWSPRSSFVLVGDGYPSREVVRTLGIEVLGRLPYDRAGAAALSGRTKRRTGPAKSLLGRTLTGLADAAASRASVSEERPDAAYSVKPRSSTAERNVVRTPWKGAPR
ncbi:hypothetical protein OHT76_05720 [Streptomyces sp. NBC_00287]|uniref:hypothetical protein n=1 Tax=Streptomyces sp. NBC_00287 TaxID=2975702 RepID=UPI002E282B79|nr:hypothetical protein [Streptomyces sp. NBC_00287]